MVARAERNAYPLIGLKPAEVREAVAKLKSTDRDEWAAVMQGGAASKLLAVCSLLRLVLDRLDVRDAGC